MRLYRAIRPVPFGCSVFSLVCNLTSRALSLRDLPALVELENWGLNGQNSIITINARETLCFSLNSRS